MVVREQCVIITDGRHLCEVFALGHGLDGQPLDGALVEGLLEQELARLRVDPHLSREGVMGLLGGCQTVIDTSKHPVNVSFFTSFKT